MHRGLGCPAAARSGARCPALLPYQVWCPHAALGPRTGAQPAQAITVAAPALAPQVSLLPELLVDGTTLIAPSSETGGGCSGSSASAAHGESHSVPLVAVAPAHSAVAHDLPPEDAFLRPSGVGRVADDQSSGEPSTSSPASPAPHGGKRRHGKGRRAGDERSPIRGSSNTSGSSGINRHNRHDGSVGRSSTGQTGAPGRPSGAGSCTTSSDRTARNSASSGSSSGSGSGGPNAADPAPSMAGDGGGGAARSTTSQLPLPGGAGAGAASRTDAGAAAGGSKNAATARAIRSSKTLEALHQQSEQLRAVDLDTLRQRLQALASLLGLPDEERALALAAAVPPLLLAPPESLGAALRAVTKALGADEATARGVAAAAPLVLLLPPGRVGQTVASLRAALRVSRPRAAALCASFPQLATLSPPTLAAKLEGLRRLLGPSATAQDLAAALDSAPLLLTFSTAALESHHTALTAMLGPSVVAAALRREPGLLALSPATVAPKLRLLAELLGCRQQPAAVALLVCRHPGVLRRSLTALSRCCRALSVWALHPRAKLRMCLSRRCLLTLPWQEVHGRCRWLRRLMLSNAYYHTALRRLPPAVLGRLLAVLPGGWGRLQYLADSSQEGCMGLLEAAECGQREFEERFPEYGRWLAWKLKQMGADNPWRGANRIRGIGTPKDLDRDREKAAARGGPGERHLSAQRQAAQRAAVAASARSRQAALSAGPTVPVVLQEAGTVRSGGSTVSRPRRVVQQALEPRTPSPLGGASAAAGAGAAVAGDGVATAAAVSPSTLRQQQQEQQQPLAPCAPEAGAAAEAAAEAASRPAADADGDAAAAVASSSSGRADGGAAAAGRAQLGAGADAVDAARADGVGASPPGARRLAATAAADAGPEVHAGAGPGPGPGRLPAAVG